MHFETEFGGKSIRICVQSTDWSRLSARLAGMHEICFERTASLVRCRRLQSAKRCDMRGWDRAVTFREQEALTRARVRLLEHAALERAPELPASPPARVLGDVPRPVLRELFEDLVRRTEKGPEIAQVRSLGRPPPESLRTLWDETRDRGYDPEQLADRRILKHVVVHPVEEVLAIPGAKAVEQEMAQTREYLSGLKGCSREATHSLPREGQSHTKKLIDTGSQSPLDASPSAVTLDSSGGALGKVMLNNASHTDLQTRASPVTDDGMCDIDEDTVLQGDCVKATCETATKYPSAPSRRKGAAHAGAVTGNLNLSSLRVGGSECCFCPDPALFGNVELKSELLGPFVNARGRASLRVHFECACWAPQVYVDNATGRFQHIYDEYLRGRQLRCVGCGGRGATVGCYVEKCKKVFHFRCLNRAKARRVDKFFVAFCRTHAHLVDQESYQLMMEAATIADVARNRKDKTYGLDTPHSKYTMLRRCETELIFSARAGICSHTGALESAKVTLSTRKRIVLNSSQALSSRDRPRRVRVSALDVATGRLALLAIGNIYDGRRVTAVQANAAVASKHYSPIFLLRNLERAPEYATGEILIPKSRSRASRSNSFNGTADGATPRRSSPGHVRKRARSELQHIRNCSEQIPESMNFDRESSTSPSDAVHSRAKYQCRSENSSSESDADDRGVKYGHSERREHRYDQDAPTDPNGSSGGSGRGGNVLRVPLSEKAADSVREDRVHARRQCQAQREAKLSRERRQKDRDERARRRKAKMDQLRQKASKVAGVFGDVEMPAPASQCVIAKVRSAWEIFLDEQLVKERTLRPEDPIEVAMRNMACLWGLLLPHERAIYEERARHGIGLSIMSSKNADEAQERTSQSLVPNKTVDDCVSDTVRAANAAALATSKVRSAPFAHIQPSPLANNDMRIANRRTISAEIHGAVEMNVLTSSRAGDSLQRGSEVVCHSRSNESKVATGRNTKSKMVVPPEQDCQDAGLFNGPPKENAVIATEAKVEKGDRSVNLPVSALGSRNSRARVRGGSGSLRLRDSEWDDIFPVELKNSSSGVRAPPPRRK